MTHCVPDSLATAQVINLDQALDQIQQLWTPHIIATINDVEFKLARLQGEFVCHAHPDTDEAFLLLRGSLTIRLDDREVELHPGELFVVPRGVRHQPVAKAECQVLLVEATDTLNTGDAATEARSTQGVRCD